MAKKLPNITPLFSILICTIPERFYCFNDLKSALEEQVSQNKLQDLVEILTDDRLGITVGKKRNELMARASGEFVAFIDDDDEVSKDYVRLIVETIQNNANLDCIGIYGEMIFDKIHRRKWFISIKNEEWFEKDLVFYRTPNHISPIRRTIANQCAFPDVSNNEDRVFSHLVYPLLHKESIIETPLYIYHYSSKSERLVWR